MKKIEQNKCAKSIKRTPEKILSDIKDNVNRFYMPDRDIDIFAVVV